jgi:hypothetical protein
VNARYVDVNIHAYVWTQLVFHQKETLALTCLAWKILSSRAPRAAQCVRINPFIETMSVSGHGPVMSYALHIDYVCVILYIMTSVLRSCHFVHLQHFGRLIGLDLILLCSFARQGPRRESRLCGRPVWQTTEIHDLDQNRDRAILLFDVTTVSNFC